MSALLVILLYNFSLACSIYLSQLICVCYATVCVIDCITVSLAEVLYKFILVYYNSFFYM